MLQVDHINKTIQGRIILEDISFDLAQGNLIISGPSGCGKSTLAHIIAGLDKQYTGSLRLDGRLMHDYKTKQWMRDIQYVPQYQRTSMDPRQTVEAVLTEPLK
ncbi:MAG: ATP-binding cassette domain-containing protein, partial [Staphylococcus lugdunensis]|nr:ATP-binding cassette domain-containing protein [Staphylococcus lugdunensis]